MIEFQDVSVVYPNEHIVLSHVSLQITKGEFVCIIGPTGAGKSTLLKLICYAEVPTHGCVRVAGLDLQDLRPRDVRWLRRGIGLVSTDFDLLPEKTLFENVAWPLRVMGVARGAVSERVRDVLSCLDLLHRRRAYPHQMSTGEQQLARLARAWVHEPMILIADQPTGNLDPSLSLRVAGVLSQIHAQGTTVVVATNDKQLVAAPARRVLAFEEGSLVRDELWEAPPTGPEVAAELLEALQDEPPDAENPSDGYSARAGLPWRVLLGETARNLRGKGLVSAAALLIVLLCMITLGGVLAGLYRLRQIAESLPHHFEIAVFLPKALSDAEAQLMQKRISAWPDVAEVRWVPKEEAWFQMQREDQAGGLPLADALEGENPLPDRLDVRVTDPRRLASVADNLRQLGNDYKVRDERAALDKMMDTLQLAALLGGGGALLLFLVNVLVIRNTLRSTILARRHETRALQWMGAPAGFTRGPLVLESLFYGIVGGAAASWFVLQGTQRLSAAVTDYLPAFVQTLPPFVRPDVFVGALVGIGVLCGLLGSGVSAGRSLK